MKDANTQAVAIEMVSRIRNTASRESWLVPEFSLRLVDEVMGITDENRGVFVYRTHQIFRQDMPKVLERQFTRKLTQMSGEFHLGLARTDIAALGETLPVRNIREMIAEPKLRTTIVGRPRLRRAVSAVGGA